MHHFHNILYLSKGTGHDTNGLTQALQLAAANQAKLTALIITPPLPKDFESYKAQYVASVELGLKDNLAQAAQTLGLNLDAIDLTIETQDGKKPAFIAIQHVLKHDHDLVILESEYDGNKRGIHAVDMDMLRKCPCPVWLCRPSATPDQQTRVVVAIDPISEDALSEALSLRMLELSDSIAAACGVPLQVISCWDYEFEDYLRHNPWVETEDDDIAKIVREEEESHRAALDILLTKAGITMENCDIHHLRGRAEDIIPTFTRENAIDIMVMGTVARTGIPGFFMGNTAENILQTLSCSLVALKPRGFISPVKAYG